MKNKTSCPDKPFPWPRTTARGAAAASLPRRIATVLVYLGSVFSLTYGAAQQPPAGLTDVYLASALRPVLEVAASTSRIETILLENRGGEEATVRLYVRDYGKDDQGADLYEAPGTLPRSNAEWITLSSAEVRLAPGERRSVPYRIDVPKGEGLNGSYWSMIMVEPVNQDEVQYQAVGENARLGVRTVFRYGISVVTNLTSQTAAQLEFTNPRFNYTESDGRYRLTLRLNNPGERLLEPKLWLELYSTDGQQIGRFGDLPVRVFPGFHVNHTFDLGDLDEGDYQALVIADAGDDDLFGIRYALNVTFSSP